MWFKALTVLALVAASHAAAVAGDGNREEKGLEALVDLLNIPSLFSLVTFNNDPCDTESGVEDGGTCYTAKECTALEGTADGTCAQGHGVCCVVPLDVTVSENNTQITSPGFSNARALPSARALISAGIITITIEPPKDVTQILVQLNTLILTGPTEGECGNDTFIVVGNNPGTEIPVLCGDNSGQHIYIDIDNSDGPYKLLITTSAVEFDRSYDMNFIFYSASSAYKAPPRCLQYHKAIEGEIMSFNYADDTPMALNNQNYAICFGYVSGYCDISMDVHKFDLGDINGDCDVDGVTQMGDRKLCGDFEDIVVQVNATMAIISLNVMTDDSNELEEEGFSISYAMMEC